MTVDVLLDRLDGVLRTGPDRWRARCPAHQSTARTLSIREVGDRVLLHCFAGCDVLDVLAAVGLTAAALFDKPTSHIGAPRSTFPAREALACIDREVIVAQLIIGDVLNQRAVDASQWQRLALAAERIGDARDLCCPARVGKEAAKHA